MDTTYAGVRKFEVSSFTRSEVREGVPKFLKRSHDPDLAPFWGITLSLDITYLYSKFELPTFAQSGDIDRGSENL